MGIEDIWILDDKFYHAAVDATAMLLKQIEGNENELLSMAQLIYRFNACLYTSLNGPDKDFMTAANLAISTYMDSLREVYHMPDEHQAAACACLCFYCEILKRNLDDDRIKAG